MTFQFGPVTTYDPRLNAPVKHAWDASLITESQNLASCPVAWCNKYLGELIKVEYDGKFTSYVLEIPCAALRKPDHNYTIAGRRDDVLHRAAELLASGELVLQS